MGKLIEGDNLQDCGPKCFWYNHAEVSGAPHSHAGTHFPPPVIPSSPRTLSFPVWSKLVCDTSEFQLELTEVYLAQSFYHQQDLSWLVTASQSDTVNVPLQHGWWFSVHLFCCGRRSAVYGCTALPQDEWGDLRIHKTWHEIIDIRRLAEGGACWPFPY